MDDHTNEVQRTSFEDLKEADKAKFDEALRISADEVGRFVRVGSELYSSNHVGYDLKRHGDKIRHVYFATNLRNLDNLSNILTASIKAVGEYIDHDILAKCYGKDFEKLLPYLSNIDYLHAMRRELALEDKRKVTCLCFGDSQFPQAPPGGWRVNIPHPIMSFSIDMEPNIFTGGYKLCVHTSYKLRVKKEKSKAR